MPLLVTRTRDLFCRFVIIVRPSNGRIRLSPASSFSFIDDVCKKCSQKEVYFKTNDALVIALAFGNLKESERFGPQCEVATTLMFSPVIAFWMLRCESLGGDARDLLERR